MTSFFTILFILLGVNAIFMFFGMNTASQKDAKTKEKDTADSSATKVYPMDLSSSKFKKAV